MVYFSVKQGMPLTDGESIKSCLITAAEEMCPEKNNLFKIISHLVWWAVLTVEGTGSDINRQLNKKANDGEWFSLALDGSTDVTGTV